jgi:hypothetical protein
VTIAAVVVAVTRVWAMSRTLWDWDEALFAMALHDFDVPQHHPHPPGFPLFVLLGKLVRLVVSSDFRALQLVTLTAAMALFPLAFTLARELRFDFLTAFLGSLLLVFFPNVWFFGGTAFSDVPGLALAVAAAALLLRGCRDVRAFYAGAIVLGLAAAIRPQALVIGCVPSLLALWFQARRSWKHAVSAPLAGALVIAVAYGGAALASQSVTAYLGTARALREYVRKVDSFLNPGRQPLPTLFDDFFVNVIPGGRISMVVAILAAVAIIASIVRPAWRVWLLLAMFLPFNIMGWLLLDVNSISRYSIGFAAMYALLAAEGVRVLALAAKNAAPAVQVVVLALIVGRYAWWTIPALREVRSTVSPPVAAMEWLVRNAPRDQAKLYVHGSVAPWVSYYLPGWNVTRVSEPADIPAVPAGRHDYHVTEGLSGAGGAQNFIRPNGRIYDIARRRYFQVSVAPITGLGHFNEGWYWEEGDGEHTWRWMSGRGTMSLQPIVGRASLMLEFSVPTELVPRKPVAEIVLNGKVLDRFIVASAEAVRKEWVVDARGDARNELVITMDKVLNPMKEGLIADERDLGLQLHQYWWRPVS